MEKMIYVPMLKMRVDEMLVAKQMNFSFSEKTIPLIEIINNKYKVIYKTDENGECIKEKRKDRMYRGVKNGNIIKNATI